MDAARAKKLIRALFAAVLAAGCLSGFLRTFFFAKDTLESENRTANRPGAFSVSSFLRGEFQEQLEAALIDQLPGSSEAKGLYHASRAEGAYTLLGGVYRTRLQQYHPFFGGLFVFGEHLVYPQEEMTPSNRAGLELFCESLFRIRAAHPDLPLHVFYVESEKDVDLSSGERAPFYDLLAEGVGDSASLFRFEHASFSDYSEHFYRTDHHWNHAGSYAGYLALCEALGCDPAVERGAQYTVGADFDGSKSVLAGGRVIPEEMQAYDFDFPAMTVTVNGEAVEDYGHQGAVSSEFLAEGERLTYAAYYGENAGEVIFETEKSAGERVLVLGDSFDNAVLKLLASQFQATFAVDLRYWRADAGGEFDLDSYLAEHGIGRVVFLGGLDYFVSDEFRVG